MEIFNSDFSLHLIDTQTKKMVKIANALNEGSLIDYQVVLSRPELFDVMIQLQLTDFNNIKYTFYRTLNFLALATGPRAHEIVLREDKTGNDSEITVTFDGKMEQIYKKTRLKLKVTVEAYAQSALLLSNLYLVVKYIHKHENISQEAPNSEYHNQNFQKKI